MWYHPTENSAEGKEFFLVLHLLNVGLTTGKKGYVSFLATQVAERPCPSRRGKRCRIVKDRIRLWKAGVRGQVMERCCALHNFRVRLHPWQPMV